MGFFFSRLFLLLAEICGLQKEQLQGLGRTAPKLCTPHPQAQSHSAGRRSKAALRKGEKKQLFSNKITLSLTFSPPAFPGVGFRGFTRCSQASRILKPTPWPRLHHLVFVFVILSSSSRLRHLVFVNPFINNGVCPSLQLLT